MTLIVPESLTRIFHTNNETFLRIFYRRVAIKGSIKDCLFVLCTNPWMFRHARTERALELMKSEPSENLFLFMYEQLLRINFSTLRKSACFAPSFFSDPLPFPNWKRKARIKFRNKYPHTSLMILIKPKHAQLLEEGKKHSSKNKHRHMRIMEFM
jgi:hypothetical protein